MKEHAAVICRNACSKITKQNIQDKLKKTVKETQNAAVFAITNLLSFISYTYRWQYYDDAYLFNWTIKIYFIL